MSTNPFWPVYDVDLFGPLVAAADVRDAARATLQTWVALYTDEIRRRTGTDPRAMPDFQDWEVRPEYRTLPVTAAPACMVTCLGTSRRPQRHGDGTVTGWWAVEVSSVVFAPTWELAEDLAGWYGLAARAALLQHPDLGGVAETVEWTGERYTEVEHSSTRTLGVNRSTFEVQVARVLNTTAGPAAVTDPTGLPPTATSIQVTVDKEPL